MVATDAFVHLSQYMNSAQIVLFEALLIVGFAHFLCTNQLK